jgi:hypothetical protein
MAGNDTPAIVSKAAPFTSKVEMTKSSLVATADDGRISPRSEQTTSALEEAKNPEELTEMLKKWSL